MLDPQQISIIDLLNLGPADLTGAIDDEAGLTLFSPAGNHYFPAEVVDRLLTLLQRNSHQLQEELGGVALTRRIFVWRTNHARNMICHQNERTFFHMEQFPGLLYPWSEFKKTFYYAGLTVDMREAVLVPADLYASYVREQQLAFAMRELQTNDPHLLAMAIQTCEEVHDPENGAPSPLVLAAQTDARSVAYWRELAGSIPRTDDAYDARRPLQLRHTDARGRQFHR